MMSKVGLVRQEWLGKVSAAYELYRGNVEALTAEEDADIRRLDADAAAAAFKEKYCCREACGSAIPIKLLGCFDTVGSLGVPDSVFGGGLDNSRYAFHDTTLGAHVEHAVHALSVDEERGGMRPTVMVPSSAWVPADATAAAKGQLSQLYFPGSHSGVGGGKVGETGTSAYALAWMVAELRARGIALALHEDRLPPFRLDETPKASNLKRRVRVFAMRVAAGRYVREIRDTTECHPAVAYRLQHVEQYRPAALCMPTKFNKKTALADALKRAKLDTARVLNVLHAYSDGEQSSSSSSDSD